MKAVFENKKLEEISKKSLLFPYIVVDKNNKPVEVTIITAIRGMRTNNGIPTEMDVEVHKPDDTILKQKYKLTK